MRATLIAFAGPAASGKDTLAHGLARLLEQEHRVQLISGTALFRAAALFAVEKGYNPRKRLPSDAYQNISILQTAEDKVNISDGYNQVTYSPKDYSRSEIGIAGSDLARNSPDIYKTFVKTAILEQIQLNGKNGIHSILPSRQALEIAADVQTPSLCVYLSVRVEEKIRRLEHRLRKNKEPYINEAIQRELSRDLQDIKSGTLPEDSKDYLPLVGRESYQSHKTYRFDTTSGTIEENIERLHTATCAFIRECAG